MGATYKSPPPPPKSRYLTVIIIADTLQLSNALIKECGIKWELFDCFSKLDEHFDAFYDNTLSWMNILMYDTYLP